VGRTELKFMEVTMFRTTTTVLTTALIGACVNAPAAVAAAAVTTGTACIAEWDITISPGVGARPSFGRYGTAGEDGVITCQGPLNGHAVTGPGTWGAAGTYGTAAEQDDCLGVHGPIRFTFAIPTDAGPRHGSTEGRFDYGLRHGPNPLGAQLDTPLATGSYQFTPLQGDCLTQPLTRGHLRFQFLLTDVAPSRA
jgi:hypothetical protein